MRNVLFVISGPSGVGKGTIAKKLIERNSQFALQNVFDVINRRWESGKPLIVTTNLELDAIRTSSEGDITRARINDRLLEMCKPIHVVGENKRRESGKQKMGVLKEIFEGGTENDS